MCIRDRSLSDNGHIVAIGGPFNDVTGNDAGSVQVYKYIEGTGPYPSMWLKMGGDIYAAATGDLFGNSVSLNGSGNILAIGAPYNDDNEGNSGSVNIYEFKDEDWVLMGTSIYGETANEQCGQSVSLSSDGHTVAISSPQCSTDNANLTGCVNIYKWKENSWNIMGSTIYGNYWTEKFGSCISLSSDGLKLAIGARLFNNKGYVYVYEWLNDAWTRMGNSLSADLETATGKLCKYLSLIHISEPTRPY